MLEDCFPSSTKEYKHVQHEDCDLQVDHFSRKSPSQSSVISPLQQMCVFRIACFNLSNVAMLLLLLERLSTSDTNKNICHAVSSHIKQQLRLMQIVHFQVPFRRIKLTGGSGHFDAYDTSGPQV